MDALEILKALSESDRLLEEVLAHLNDGMWDEWDCSIADALANGFGGVEFMIAAKAAYGMALYEKGTNNA